MSEFGCQSSVDAGFSADWLAVREPADAAARSTRLTRAIADSFVGGAELRVLDLGAGTGANMRYLAPRLPEPQRWLLVDHDRALLASVATRDDGPRRVATRQLDLRAIGDREAHEMFSGRALVTASALLDLVSEEWMRALGMRCREAGAALLFALTYDGRIWCAPEEPEDAEVRTLVNRHQRTDRDSPALAPMRPRWAQTVLAAWLSRRVRAKRLGARTRGAGSSAELIDGWAQAAVETAPGTVSRTRALAGIAAGARRRPRSRLSWAIRTRRMDG